MPSEQGYGRNTDACDRTLIGPEPDLPRGRIKCHVSDGVVARPADAVKHNRTVLIISHNISQIMDDDTIYVMSDGEIVAHGTHESLYLDGGLYREIIDSNARTLNIGRLAATVVAGPRAEPAVV